MAVPPGVIDRRRLLRLGLGLGVVAGAPALLGAGCGVSDPRIEGSGRGASTNRVDPGARPSVPGQPPSPDPSATPTFAGAVEGAESERRLAGLAAAVSSGPWRKALGYRAGLLAAVRDFHLAHATALQSTRPTSRPTEDPATLIKPEAVAKSLDAALDRLVTAERAVAARHRASAVVTPGFGALLWGSMSVAATAYAGALLSPRPAAVRRPKPPKPMPLLSEIEATQQLVRQLHAVDYGYLLAIGQLTDGSRRNAAIRQLRSWRVLRDGLVAVLVARRAEIPIAEPAYAPTVFPRNDATAALLLQDMESRLAPFVGLWLAAVPTVPERTRAFDALSTTVATTRTWGGRLCAWPGWP